MEDALKIRRRIVKSDEMIDDLKSLQRL